MGPRRTPDWRLVPSCGSMVQQCAPRPCRHCMAPHDPHDSLPHEWAETRWLASLRANGDGAGSRLSHWTLWLQGRCPRCHSASYRAARPRRVTGRSHCPSQSIRHPWRGLGCVITVRTNPTAHLGCLSPMSHPLQEQCTHAFLGRLNPCLNHCVRHCVCHCAWQSPSGLAWSAWLPCS